MFLRAIIYNSMKKQDVRKLQKKIIENSISGIWKSGSNKMCEKNRKCLASSCRINIKASTSIFPHSSHEHISHRCNLNENINNSNFNDDCDTQVSCTCHNCEFCDCEKNDYERDSDISSSGSNKNSSCIEASYQEKTNEESKTSSESLSKPTIEPNELKQQENIFKNLYLKKKIIQPILFFIAHIFLLFIVILLKVLCYVKYFLFCILNFKSSKRIRTIFIFLITTVAAYKLSNFIDEEYFCNLSNSISRILYSKNDAFAKILESEGKFETYDKIVLLKNYFIVFKEFRVVRRLIYISLKLKAMD
jgi:hypothetical protein